MSIYNYGTAHFIQFPDSEKVINNLAPGDIAFIKEAGTEFDYILTRNLRNWTQVSNLEAEYIKLNAIDISKAEWVMTVDDYENGWGEQKYPHCSACKRGVYKHDAGKYCPFCGREMKNPMA